MNIVRIGFALKWLIAFSWIFQRIHAFAANPPSLTSQATTSPHQVPTPPFRVCMAPNEKRTSSQLRSKSQNDNQDDPLGITRGTLVFVLAFLVNLWLFSIPPELRRARNCNEEQVRMYPDSKCMTGKMWWGAVQDYYRQGGGIHFDFSIEGKQ